jgi:hypothetical protein
MKLRSFPNKAQPPRVFDNPTRPRPAMIGPSQSSAPVYGYSLTLNEVTKLSTAEYAESPLVEFTPDAVKDCARCTPATAFPGLR